MDEKQAINNLLLMEGDYSSMEDSHHYAGAGKGGGLGHLQPRKDLGRLGSAEVNKGHPTPTLQRFGYTRGGVDGGDGADLEIATVMMTAVDQAKPRKTNDLT